jgi:hypothetical protein
MTGTFDVHIPYRGGAAVVTVHEKRSRTMDARGPARRHQAGLSGDG